MSDGVSRDRHAYLRGFDGLRAFSILLVILTHLGLYDRLPPRPYFQQNVWDLVSGTSGVHVFFVLSGFLITAGLLREKNSTGRISIRRFYVRRGLRLLPALTLFFLVLALRSMLQGVSVPAHAVVMAVGYVYNYAPLTLLAGAGSLLRHMWSLAVEEQFYLLWPVLILILLPRAQVRLAVTGVITCAVAVLALPGLSVRHAGRQLVLSDLFGQQHWLIPAAAPILIGALAAIWSHDRSPRTLPEIWQGRWMPAIAIALWLSPLALNGLFLNWSYFVRSAGVAILLLWLTAHPQAALTKLLEQRAIAYLGRISYGLYLYHPLFIGVDGRYALFPSRVGCLAAALVFTLLSFELVERPILRLKKKWAPTTHAVGPTRRTWRSAPTPSVEV